MKKNGTTGKVRLADIAALAGVSTVTASKVLSGHSGNNTRVSTETREKVQRLARELGYRPSMAAKMLAGKSTQTIGVLLDVNSPPVHFMQVSQMQVEAEKSDYWLITGECRPTLANISSFIDDFMSRGVDGFITISHVHPNIGREVMKMFSRTGKPVVYFDMPPAFMTPEPACVHVNLAAGVSSAVEYLYARGRRRLALLMPWINLENGNYHFVTERERGFCETLERFALPCDLEFNYRYNLWGQPLTRATAFPVIARLFEEQQPDAIVANNDFFAALTLSYCHRHGLAVPDDLAVIGFDDLEFSDYVYPALTTMHPFIEEGSRAAVKLLLEMIRSGTVPEHHQIEFIPKLIKRESA